MWVLPGDDPLVFVYPVAADLLRELADQFDVTLTGPPQVYFLYAERDRRPGRESRGISS